MPLFGEKRDNAAEEQAARAVLDWAIHLPPGDLAAELMTAFGADGPKGGDLSCFELARGLLSRAVRPQFDMPFEFEVTWLVREAVQLLEHAELICLAGTVNAPSYRPTRLGSATLASGKAAIRQRIKDRTGL